MGTGKSQESLAHTVRRTVQRHDIFTPPGKKGSKLKIFNIRGCIFVRRSAVGGRYLVSFQIMFSSTFFLTNNQSFDLPHSSVTLINQIRSHIPIFL